ncbi:hypothetical protein BH20ACT22_BH20ACT22_22560 [soil metagenome]
MAGLVDRPLICTSALAVTYVYSCRLMLKTVLWWLLVAFLIFFIVSAPGEAARIVRATGENAGDWFTTAANAFTTFFSRLV